MSLVTARSSPTCWLYPEAGKQAETTIFMWENELTRAHEFSLPGFKEYLSYPRVCYFLKSDRCSPTVLVREKGSGSKIGSGGVVVFSATVTPGNYPVDYWKLYVHPAPVNGVLNPTQLERVGQEIEVIAKIVRVERSIPIALPLNGPCDTEPEGDYEEQKSGYIKKSDVCKLIDDSVAANRDVVCQMDACYSKLASANDRLNEFKNRRLE